MNLVNSPVHDIVAAPDPEPGAHPPVPSQRGAYGVRVDHLTVSTKAGFALDIQDLEIQSGETVAIVGANGAGKTTFLEALLGLRKTETARGAIGSTSLADWARSPAQRRRMGVMLQRTALPFGLKVRDVLDLHRRIYGLQEATVLDSLDIDRMRGFNYDWLSRGQRQRVDLLMALGHSPDLVLLDEPFTGLDQQFATATYNLLSGMSSATILLACHSAHELSLADRLLWIREGRVAAFDSPQVLMHRFLGEYALKIKLKDAAGVEHLREQAGSLARMTHAPHPDQLNLFGGSELQTLAHTLIGGADATSVEFGATNLTDLLHFCALEKAHA